MRRASRKRSFPRSFGVRDPQGPSNADRAAAIASSTSASRASATCANTWSLWGLWTGKVAPEWAGTNSPPTKRPYRWTSVMRATKVKGGKELVPPSPGFVDAVSRSGEALNSHIPVPRRGASMEGEDSSGVKYLVGKTAGKSGVIAGLVATHIATIFGLWFYGARLPKFDFPSLNGYIYVGLPFGFTHPDVAFVVGGVFHYVDGILFGLIFALVVSPMMGRVLKPLAPMTPTTNYIKGLIWGWTLWIISSALWMPLLIGPILAPYGAPVGVFLTSFDGYGVQALLANLLWHTIWGANLGLIFSPRPASGGARSWMRATAAEMR